MGTHPIFESDFDCLTDCIKKKVFENMKKELDQQKAKVQQAAQQRAMIAQQGEMLEKQQAENKLVLMELDATEEDAVCYKVAGPALIPKSVAESKALIKERQTKNDEALKKLKASMEEVQKRFLAEQKTLKELNDKARQIEEALA